jgi:outer membrane protein OmpA-like peptidoglycan-associated protein
MNQQNRSIQNRPLQTQIRIAIAAAALGLLSSCASVPSGPPPDVVRLENEMSRLHNDPRIAPNATRELADADAAINVLATQGRHMEAREYEHDVYIAERLIQTAEAEGLARYAEVRAKDLGGERDRLMVSAKSRELRDARVATADALATADAERRDADMARQDAQTTHSEIASLRADLADLQAQQTQQGFVVTLGDFLFEVDRSELKPGAARTLDGLVHALSDDSGATVAIDGHTDATGSRDHNLDLSLRRAEAVRDYLAMHGINPARISTQGLGPDYPVASNSTEAGRQQNRRVEVIVQTSVARR